MNERLETAGGMEVVDALLLIKNNPKHTTGWKCIEGYIRSSSKYAKFNNSYNPIDPDQYLSECMGVILRCIGKFEYRSASKAMGWLNSMMDMATTNFTSSIVDANEKNPEDALSSGRKTFVKLDGLPEGLKFPETIKKISYNPEKKELSYRGAMPFSVLSALLRLSTEKTYQEAINTLYEDSAIANRTKRVISILECKIPQEGDSDYSAAEAEYFSYLENNGDVPLNQLQENLDQIGYVSDALLNIFAPDMLQTGGNPLESQKIWDELKPKLKSFQKEFKKYLYDAINEYAKKQKAPKTTSYILQAWVRGRKPADISAELGQNNRSSVTRQLNTHLDQFKRLLNDYLNDNLSDMIKELKPYLEKHTPRFGASLLNRKA